MNVEHLSLLHGLSLLVGDFLAHPVRFHNGTPGAHYELAFRPALRLQTEVEANSSLLIRELQKHDNVGGSTEDFRSVEHTHVADSGWGRSTIV